MNSSCNIAICLSGEPRLNEIAGTSIKNIINDLLNERLYVIIVITY